MVVPLGMCFLSTMTTYETHKYHSQCDKLGLASCFTCSKCDQVVLPYSFRALISSTVHCCNWPSPPLATSFSSAFDLNVHLGCPHHTGIVLCCAIQTDLSNSVIRHWNYKAMNVPVGLAVPRSMTLAG